MAMTLITTNPDSTDVASIEFTSSIDSTYKLYIFKWYDANPAVDASRLYFNGSTDGGSNYDVTKTTTNWDASHNEDDSGANIEYQTGNDLAQDTGLQALAIQTGSGADESSAGTLWLFNPASTTYVKHFYATVSNYRRGDEMFHEFIAGYFNTTSAINAIIFSAQGGNMDGVIKMYGVG